MKKILLSSLLAALLVPTITKPLEDKTTYWILAGLFGATTVISFKTTAKHLSDAMKLTTVIMTKKFQTNGLPPELQKPIGRINFAIQVKQIPEILTSLDLSQDITDDKLNEKRTQSSIAMIQYGIIGATFFGAACYCGINAYNQ
ncbi:MAG: hypothetical protein WC707_04530 [Candidatus Babeliaceae bacterium]|jgi:hypothetical protein